MTSVPISAYRLNRSDNAGIGAAAADIAAHTLAHIVVVRAAGFAKERDRGHNLSGGAVAALESVMIDEGLLHRMETIVLGKSFDRGDRAILKGGGKREARQHAAA